MNRVCRSASCPLRTLHGWYTLQLQQGSNIGCGRSNKDQAMLSRAQQVAAGCTSTQCLIQWCVLKVPLVLQVLVQREQARDMLQNIALAMEDEEDDHGPAVAAPLPEPDISTLLDRSYRPKPAQLGQLEAAMKHVLQKR